MGGMWHARRPEVAEQAVPERAIARVPAGESQTRIFPRLSPTIRAKRRWRRNAKSTEQAEVRCRSAKWKPWKTAPEGPTTLKIPCSRSGSRPNRAHRHDEGDAEGRRRASRLQLALRLKSLQNRQITEGRTRHRAHYHAVYLANLRTPPRPAVHCSARRAESPEPDAAHRQLVLRFDRAERRRRGRTPTTAAGERTGCIRPAPGAPPAWGAALWVAARLGIAAVKVAAIR